MECLEPYLLRDQLPGLTTHVMKDLLLHFQDRGLMESLEACIVHMDITSLDIQQVFLTMSYILITSLYLTFSVIYCHLAHFYTIQHLYINEKEYNSIVFLTDVLVFQFL